MQFDLAGAGVGRYRLLETVRQYAAGQLDELGPAVADAALVAHRDYYLALAEAAAPHLIAHGQAEWLDRLDADLGNLRAAIAFSLTQPDPEPGLRLAASLREFWAVRGHAAEAIDVLQELLTVPAAREPTLPRARTLAAAAHLLDRAGSCAAAEHYCEEALAIARAADDGYLIAEVLHIRAWVLLRLGQLDTALPLIEDGLDLASRLQKPHLTGRLLAARSVAMDASGDHAGAVRDAAGSLRLFRQAGDQLYAGAMLGNLGYYELSAGDLDAARRPLTESLDIGRAFDDPHIIAYETFTLGLAEYLGGSPGAAEALFAESLGLARRVGMKAPVAYALIGLAMAGHAGADPGWSARLHGAADQALADLGRVAEPLEGRLADQDRRRLRAAMGDGAFDAEYAAGRALDLARAADLALQGLQAGREAARAGALVSEPDADISDEAGSVLTPRELEVLKLVALGLSNSDVAQRLVLSEHTVHRHLANILRKLNLSSRAAAAAWGARTGLV